MEKKLRVKVSLRRKGLIELAAGRQKRGERGGAGDGLTKKRCVWGISWGHVGDFPPQTNIPPIGANLRVCQPQCG